ncbi:hypothetical protein JTE90_016033 [Oedothorax gibbosus]|uniref:Uncharacterized protein n=1 Tax=Oedothorax gibbosus TaxID=931172 RepID=A0AAV6VRA4_9ARAC|nr:hypothetical protein JTE90_016033 [Oedothorax gibbosus]
MFPLFRPCSGKRSATRKQWVARGRGVTRGSRPRDPFPGLRGQTRPPYSAFRRQPAFRGFFYTSKMDRNRFLEYVLGRTRENLLDYGTLFYLPVIGKNFMKCGAHLLVIRENLLDNENYFYLLDREELGEKNIGLCHYGDLLFTIDRKELGRI